jgi:hypothetical protein
MARTWLQRHSAHDQRRDRLDRPARLVSHQLPADLRGRDDRVRGIRAEARAGGRGRRAPRRPLDAGSRRCVLSGGVPAHPVPARGHRLLAPRPSLQCGRHDRRHSQRYRRHRARDHPVPAMGQDAGDPTLAEVAAIHDCRQGPGAGPAHRDRVPGTVRPRPVRGAPGAGTRPHRGGLDLRTCNHPDHRRRLQRRDPGQPQSVTGFP